MDGMSARGLFVLMESEYVLLEAVAYERDPRGDGLIRLRASALKEMRLKLVIIDL
jgi:hypothetical protein